MRPSRLASLARWLRFGCRPQPRPRCGPRLVLEWLEDRTLLDSAGLSGPESPTQPTIEVALSAAAAKPVAVSYAVVGGTAISGKDFRLTPGPLTFKPGAPLAQVLPLTILDDGLYETNETIQIKLTASAGAHLASSSLLTYTILESDPPPTVAFGAAAGSGPVTTSASIPVVLSTASGLPVTVAYTITGSALPGVDYTPPAGTLTFKPGQTRQTLTIPVRNSHRDQPDPTLHLTLTATGGATLGSITAFTYTIHESNPPPTVGFLQKTGGSPESVPRPAIPVALSAPSGRVVTVDYTVIGGSAVPGADFTLAAGRLTFNPGTTVQAIPLAILNDGKPGSPKTIQIQLKNFQNASAGSRQVFTYTLNENDPNVSFAQATASGPETTAKVDLPLVLSAPAAAAVTVQYTVLSSSSAVHGTNYIIAAGPLSIPAGQTTANIVLTVRDDHLSTANRTVQVRFTSVTGAALGFSTVETYTIVDGDPLPVIGFGAATGTGPETTSAGLPLALSTPSGQAVTVAYQVTGGSAFAGIDYAARAATGTLTIPAGQLRGTLTLPLLNDQVYRADTTLQVTLLGATGARLGANTAFTYTIHNINPAPTVGFLVPRSSGSEAIAAPSLQVVLSAPSGQVVTVHYADTGKGSARAANYALTGDTLTFNPGERVKTIPLTVLDDGRIDPALTVQLALSSASVATLSGNRVATYTILDADALPTVSFVASAASGLESSPSPRVLVALSAVAGQPVTVAYADAHVGSATAGVDYRLDAGTLTFNPGEQVKSIPLTIRANNQRAASATLQLRLSGPSHATLGQNRQFTYTIQNVDPAAGFDTTGPAIAIDPAAFVSADSTTVAVDGSVTDDLSGVAGLQVQLDGGAFAAVPLAAGNHFSLRVPLASGNTHALRLRATDRAGNATEASVPLLDLAAGTQPGTASAHSTSDGRVTLVGNAAAHAVVTLTGADLQTSADTTGSFRFPNLTLAPGANPFTIEARDPAGTATTFSLTVTQTAPTGQANAVIVWNQAALAAIQADGTDPLLAARALAMVQAAVYDAVNSVEGTPAYYVRVAAPAGASMTAAVAAAAHDVLAYLYPAQQAVFDAMLAGQLPPGDPATTAGQGVGRAVANGIIALRRDDGSRTYVDFTPGTAPGQWQPTAPMYAPALDPQGAQLAPWGLASPSQLTPAAPPALSSPEWAAAVNEVARLGSVLGSTRTADQTQIAQFWNDGIGTYTPAGHWNAIAAAVAQQQGTSLADTARLLAELNFSLADAGITAWNTKYTYDTWRPITVIDTGGAGVNPAVTADPTWQPLLTTPNFPEYVSGHSTFSGAASTVLDAFFGAGVRFTTTEVTLPGVTRSFTGFDQAAEEAGRSRIYGGIHFSFSNTAGLAAGRAVAAYDLSTFDTGHDASAPRLALDNVLPGGASRTNFTLTGQATDNLSGVAALEVQVDDGAFAPLAFDPATGNFRFTTAFALTGAADGTHAIRLRATDAAGNRGAPVAFAFTLDTQPPALALATPADNGALADGALLTGSAVSLAPLVSLGYAFDDGVTMPVAFDAHGAFSQPLDLAALAAGAHTLVVTARDAAGNITVQTLHLTLAAPIALTVASVAPAAGANDVGVTFRPRVTFSRPIDTTTLTAANFFATDTTGAALPAAIVPSRDGTFAWLFFSQPLPGASSITLTVDGATIRAADGTLLDAAGTGSAGSKRTTTFTTVNLAPVPGTTISGIVADPGPDDKPMTRDDVRNGPDGVLGTADDVYLLPLAHVKVFILGRADEAVYTDAAGRFTLTAVPTGDVKLDIDGNTATNAPAGLYFPEMVLDLTGIRGGAANTVMGSMGPRDEQAANAANLGVYLPRLQTTILETLSSTAPTTVGLTGGSALGLTPEQEGALTMTVQPGTAIGADGQPLTNVRVGVSTVPPQLVMDMLPAGILQHSFDITIQAPGVATFTTPAAITFPNLFQAAPGAQLDLLSFDHTTGRLEISGTATVSADGLTVTTDPGSGVTHPGWHMVAPPGAQQHITTADADPPSLDQGDTTFEAGLKVDGTFSPFTVGLDFGILSLPFGKPVAWTPPPFQLPATGVPFGLGPLAFPFTVPKRIARLVPKFDDLLLFKVEAKFEIVGQAILQGSVTARGRSRDIEIEGTIAFDAVLNISFKIDNKFLNNLPWGVGNFFNSEHSLPPKVLAGTQAKFKLTLRDYFVTPPVGDYKAEIGPSFKIDVGGKLEIKPHVYLKEIADPPPGNGPTDPSLSTASGFGSAPNVYYRYFLDNGLELAGRSGPDGRIDEFLPARSAFVLYLYRPSSNHYQIVSGLTGRSGTIASSQVLLSQFGGPDTDGDGIPDIGEVTIGSDPLRADSNGDGISDAAALAQGLDLTGPGGLPTGVIASLPLAGEATAVALAGSALDARGQTAFVATGSYGLAVVDGSSFGTPVLLGQLALPGNSIDVAVDPTLKLAAVASSSGGLNLIDVADPAQPRLLRTLNGNAAAVRVKDGVAYAAFGNELRAYDLLTGEELQVISLAGNPILSLAVEGRFLYFLDAGNALHTIDIGGPLMVARGALTLPAGAGKLFVGNGIAYVGAGAGFATADVTDPDQLRLLSGVKANNVAGRQVVANGSGLAVAVGKLFGADAFDLLDVRDPTDTGKFLTRFTLPAEPLGVTLGEGIAFVADGAGGLQVVNYQPFDRAGAAPTAAIRLPAAAIVGTAGNGAPEVVEGATVAINATVADDVQVRNVELLVNGRVVQNAVALPFDLSAILPTVARNGSSTVTLQLRATDTGGNVGLSNVLTVALVPDTVPPAILASNVPDGAVHGSQFRAIAFDFSKPLEPRTITAAAFQLTGPGGTIAPSNIQLRRDNASVQLTYPPLALGSYALAIDAAAITDAAGNALGSAKIIRHFTIAAYTAEWTSPNGGAWDDPANWDTGAVPGFNDDVLINAPGNVVITHGSGAHQVRSLTSNNPIVIAGGTLDVLRTMQVNNTLTIQGGTLMGATVLPGTGGQGITLTTAGGTLDGITANADLDLGAAGALVTVSDGLTLNATATLGRYATLRFAGTEELGGTGTVLFTDNLENALIVTQDDTTLTIGPGMTIRGGNTSATAGIGYSFPWGGGANASVVNRGTIVADTAGAQLLIRTTGTFTNEHTLTAANGGALRIIGTWSNAAGATITATDSALTLGFFTDTWVNAGTIRATRGTVSLAGTWSNTGGATITATGATLNVGYSNYPWSTADGIHAIDSTVDLGGVFTTAALATLDYRGGTRNVRGTLDNRGTTLALPTAAASLNLGSGTIEGGTVTVTGGAALTGRFGTLDGVTLNGDLDLTMSNSWITVRNGLVLNGTATLGDHATLQFAGTQTLDGNGTVLLTDGEDVAVLLVAYNMTLTIGAGMTIRGGSTDWDPSGGALIGYSYYWPESNYNASIVNRGTIIADAAYMHLAVSPSGTFTNLGTLQATNHGALDIANLTGNLGTVAPLDASSLSVNGTYAVDQPLSLSNGAVLDLMGSWRNPGGISASNSIINLTGTLTTADLGTVSDPGGTVYLTGTLDNRGTTLDLTAASGSWQLERDTINGGTVNVAAGARFAVGNSSTLDGVTLNGDLDLLGPSDYLAVQDGLVLNGTVTLGEESTLAFAGTQTLGGNGTVLFTISGQNALLVSQNDTTLTIGAGITVRGGNDSNSPYDAAVIGVRVNDGSSNASIINLGTIVADAAFKHLTINPAGTFTNHGTLRADNGGTLTVNRLAQNTGTIGAGLGGLVTIAGSFSQAPTGMLTVDIGGTATGQRGTLAVSGAATLDGTLAATFVNGFVPVSGNRFKVLTFGSSSGTFSTVTGVNLPNGLNLTAVYNTTDVTLDVN